MTVDVEAELRRYGDALRAVTEPPPPDVVDDAFDEWPSPERRGFGRALLVAAAIAAVVITPVLAILLAGLGEDPASRQPAPAPAYTAAFLPAGLVPTSAQQLPAGAQPDLATVQAFSTDHGQLTVLVDVPRTPDPGNIDIRGVRGRTFLDSHPDALMWFPSDTRQVTAFGTGFDPDQLRAAVESLQARSDEPFDGFDGNRAAGIRLIAEAIVAPGTPSLPLSTVSYALPGGGWVGVIARAGLPRGSHDLALLQNDGNPAFPPTASPDGPAQVEEIAGIPRLVLSFPGGARVVAWFAEDGTAIWVAATDVSRPDLDAVVASVSADPDRWAAVRTDVSDVVAALPLVAAGDQDGTTLELRGTLQGSSDNGACVAAGGIRRCTRLGAEVGLYAVVGPGGMIWPFETARPGGTRASTLSGPSGWWIVVPNVAPASTAADEPSWLTVHDSGGQVVRVTSVPVQTDYGTHVYGFAHVDDSSATATVSSPMEQAFTLARPTSP